MCQPDTYGSVNEEYELAFSRRLFDKYGIVAPMAEDDGKDEPNE